MDIVKWAVRLTLDSSTKDRLKELAKADRRPVSNYVSRLVEKEVASSE